LSAVPPDPAPRHALFAPTYRLVGYCLLVGTFGGFAALVFEAAVKFAQKWLLEWIGGYTPPSPGVLSPVISIPALADRWWLPVATTLGGLLSGFIVYRWAPEAEGHGTDAAVAAYHQRGAEVRSRIPFVKAVASALTIGSGGVAGREGPTAQISVGLAAILGRLMKLRGQERRILLLAGMAAGLAAIFKAPLGMAIFSVEILYSGMVFESEALIYTVIAAVTAYAVFGFFAGWTPIFAIPAHLVLERPAQLVGFAVLGVAAGLFGSLLPSVLFYVRDAFRRLPGPPHIRPALGGLVVGLAGVVAPSILGTGYGWVELALAGQLSLVALLLLLLLKAPAMAFTIGSGGSGGVFAPTITVGAVLGALVGLGISAVTPGLLVPPAAYVVVGMAAVFSGCARVPISTLIMVAEMTTGYGLLVPAMLAVTIAFMVQRSITSRWRYPTLYEAQVETREDSPAHRGVFVRRALNMIEGGTVDRTDLTLPRLVSLLRFGDPIPVTGGEEMLAALNIEEGSRLAGSAVADSIGTVPGATAVAVLRQDDMLIPRGPTVLEAGDQIIVVARAEAYERLRQAAQGSGA
jgi:chloride channel protein, CIC family